MVRLLPCHDSSLDQTLLVAWILCDSLHSEDALPKSRPTVFSCACATTSPHGLLQCTTMPKVQQSRSFLVPQDRSNNEVIA